MLLIISTFFGIYWLIQYRSFKQTTQAVEQPHTAKIIALQPQQKANVKTLRVPMITLQKTTPIPLKKAK